MIFKLFAKLFDEGDGRHGRRVAERAERAAQHVFREVLNVVNVGFASKASVKAGERFLEPVGAFAAGNTPSAALVLVELHGSQGKLDHADGVVQHHHAA